MDTAAILTPIHPGLFGPEDMRFIVRVMVRESKVKDYSLTLSMGGINLKLVSDILNEREVSSELRGPGWTVVTTITQDTGKLDYGDELYLMGDVRRFETDIIYLKMALK